MPARGFRSVERFARDMYPPEWAGPQGKCLWCAAQGFRPEGPEVVNVKGITSVQDGLSIRERYTACGHFFSLTALELETLDAIDGR